MQQLLHMLLQHGIFRTWWLDDPKKFQRSKTLSRGGWCPVSERKSCLVAWKSGKWPSPKKWIWKWNFHTPGDSTKWPFWDGEWKRDPKSINGESWPANFPPLSCPLEGWPVFSDVASLRSESLCGTGPGSCGLVQRVTSKRETAWGVGSYWPSFCQKKNIMDFTMLLFVEGEDLK